MTIGDKIRAMDDIALATMIATICKTVEEDLLECLYKQGIEAVIVGPSIDMLTIKNLLYLQKEADHHDAE